jgi:hypothetical protein
MENGDASIVAEGAFNLVLASASIPIGALTAGAIKRAAAALSAIASGPRFVPSVTVEYQGAVYAGYGGACAACGIRMTRTPGPRQMNLDHPNHFAEHGPIHPLKAVPLCRTCNLDKGSMPLLEWNLYKRGMY